jgi:hypothetical protein
MSNPENYTVGWICAITAEYVAAREFLDESHFVPVYRSPQDTNDYTLGRIGNHNVVISTRPRGISVQIRQVIGYIEVTFPI